MAHTHTHITHRLSQPLHPEAAALVRQIYRRCYVLRATGTYTQAQTQTQTQTPASKEEEEEEESLGRLNTLLAVTGTFFQQAEGGEREEGEVEEGGRMEEAEAEVEEGEEGEIK